MVLHQPLQNLLPALEAAPATLAPAASLSLIPRSFQERSNANQVLQDSHLHAGCDIMDDYREDACAGSQIGRSVSLQLISPSASTDLMTKQSAHDNGDGMKFAGNTAPSAAEILHATRDDQVDLAERNITVAKMMKLLTLKRASKELMIIIWIIGQMFSGTKKDLITAFYQAEKAWKEEQMQKTIRAKEIHTAAAVLTDLLIKQGEPQGLIDEIWWVAEEFQGRTADLMNLLLDTVKRYGGIQEHDDLPSLW
ncbi:hypothetical protein IWZ00DRAFT_565268 [Phyllosticta capitalensis]